jgi:hypothetical protein
MSQSLIDEVVEVRDLPDGGREYTVSGPLGDQRAQKQGSGSDPDVHIRAMIWQTERDIGHSGTKTHAFAMSDATVATVSGEQRWTATMTHRKSLRLTGQPLPEFDPTKPGTGLAVSVDCTDDPAGFEIFTWSGPIHFKVINGPADPTASPEPA